MSFHLISDREAAIRAGHRIVTPRTYVHVISAAPTQETAEKVAARCLCQGMSPSLVVASLQTWIDRHPQ